MATRRGDKMPKKRGSAFPRRACFLGVSADMGPFELRCEIEALGLTPLEFAKLLNIGSSTVYRWLDARSPVPGSVAVLLNYSAEVRRYVQAGERLR